LNPDRPTVACIASYEKGQPFLEQMAADGCNVILLTAEKLRHGQWPWSSIAEVHTFRDVPEPVEVLKLVQHLARRLHIDRVVALDEFDLEAAALIREEMRLPGMGQSITRHFRDKLAMRVRAREMSIPVPDFIGIQNYDDLRSFLSSTRGPWLLKPRTSASAIGIRHIQNENDLWRALDELGDGQSNFLLERFLRGGVFHVDSVTWAGEILLQAVHGYGKPPMALMQGGGVFTTRTLDRASVEAQALRNLDSALLPALGMVSGVTHSEFIHAEEDGAFYFLETAARVGGAFIADLVEFSTGVNPWREWARIEAALALQQAYTMSPVTEAYAGSVITLARQEQPDLSGYSDAEIIFRMPKHHHAGLIVKSASTERVRELLADYSARFEHDFCASMPPPDRPTS
jgi:biotin carboxylase